MLIEPVSLLTSDGLRLEGELSLPSGPVWAAVVLTHPHPRQGGNMRSIVPGTLFAGLPPEGVAALRFNFRGVEGSEGTYGHGIAEQADVVAALDRLFEAIEEEGRSGPAVRAIPVVPVVPVVLAGWSFGADVALAVGDPRVAGWFAAAPPLRIVDPATMAAATDPRPKLLAVPERDQFRPPASARAVVAGWPSCRVEVVAGADHFFFGRTERLTPLCLELLRSVA